MFLILSTAFADYIAPDPDTMLRQASSVVDATVVAFDEDGHAVLDVHQTLAGEAPAELTGVAYTCFGGLTPGMYGVEEGKRYVFVNRGTEIFEETTFFAVRGDLEVEFWSTQHHGPRSWQPMNRVRARVHTARSGPRTER